MQLFTKTLDRFSINHGNLCINNRRMIVESSMKDSIMQNLYMLEVNKHKNSRSQNMKRLPAADGMIISLNLNFSKEA